jgi:hypothetical protein
MPIIEAISLRLPLVKKNWSIKAWSSSGRRTKGGRVKLPETCVLQDGQVSCDTLSVLLQLGQAIGSFGFCITYCSNVNANVNKINFMFNKIKVKFYFVK